MKIDIIHRMTDLAPGEWDRCFSDAYPFLSWGFLNALEQSDCTNSHSGWESRHLVARGDNQVLAVMPLFSKNHSWGEYVFDQEWAHAYHRYGLRYYPKLLTAAPFTPATGPRWGVANKVDERLFPAFVTAIKNQVEQQQASGWHCLFPNSLQRGLFAEAGLLERVGCQFHWFNREYQTFDDFLATFASRKRKNVRKERKAVHDAGLRFVRQSGAEMAPDEWQTFYEFYASTYYKRGHEPHLNLSFFQQVAIVHGSQIMVDWVFPPHGDKPIAAALFFFDNETLYGRYWGCRHEIDGLHFEVCFYRGIEFAIAKGLKRFDPGAQGEHKISRGFEPVETYSYHWIGHPGFRDAIARFLQEEKKYLLEYRAAAAERLPFKKELRAQVEG